MRLICLFFAFFSWIFAQNLDFNSIDSNFTQIITSSEGDSLKYEGNFYAKKPYYALWDYTKPIRKKVYFLNKKILIVEPELEQVIISKLPQNPNITNLLKNAKKDKLGNYEAKYEEITYHITLKDKKPHIITYKDTLNNRVTITLNSTNINTILDDKIFTYQIPANYDILSQ